MRELHAIELETTDFLPVDERGRPRLTDEADKAIVDAKVVIYKGRVIKHRSGPVAPDAGKVFNVYR
jgi:hypothetical protein